MEKMNCGLIAMGILSVLLGVGWILNKDGLITATIIGLIGAIAGSILGFTVAKTLTEKKEE